MCVVRRAIKGMCAYLGDLVYSQDRSMEIDVKSKEIQMICKESDLSIVVMKYVKAYEAKGQTAKSSL